MLFIEYIEGFAPVEAITHICLQCVELQKFAGTNRII